MEFKHFSHVHGLTVYHMPEGSEALCSGCKLGGLTTVYMCWQCQYFLHQNCFEAKRSFTHFSHPFHPLSLLPFPTYPSASFNCNSCHLSGTGFSYACSDCNFDIHLHCASNPSYSTVFPNNPINYPVSENPQFTHPPPRVPDSNPYPPVADHTNILYNHPSFNGHAPPASQISEAYPPPLRQDSNSYPPPVVADHTNILYNQPAFNNHVPPAPFSPYSMEPVANHVPENPYFNQNPQPIPTSSYPIENQTDVSSYETKTTQVAKHFSHQHALRQSNIEEGDRNLCSGCENAISENTAYTCTKSKLCNFRLHKSCFDLPKEIRHRSHRAHPLILLSSPPYNSYTPEFTCNACFKIGNSFLYHCSSCNFDLHVTCAVLPDSVKRDDHEHPLHLLLSSPYEKSKDGEDEVVFMCDVCQKSVDSNCWVYYCKECDFGTDIGCVNDEIERTEEEEEKVESEGARDDGLTQVERMFKMQNEFQILQFQMQMNQRMNQSIIGMGQSLARLA